jgi:type II secretory pathway pseudopilin PulG
MLRAMRIRDESGNVLATAMLLIAVMMMIGLATVATVDNQTGQSRKERERESTFNLSEAVLSSQTYVLGRNGTGTQTAPFPNTCNSSSTSSLCPSAAELARSYDGTSQPDFAAGSTWTTSVRDNQSPTSTTSDFYDPSLTDSDCGAASAATNHIYCYDQNKDNKLWVRATSTTRNKTRTIVALIQVELRQVSFPQYSVLAGSFETTNNGRKTIVDTSPSYLAVRCTGVAGSPCLDYDAGKDQVSPAANVLTGQPSQPAITEDDLVSLEDSARAAGTYYASCPSNPSGKIVYVKSGNCSYNNSTPGACCNTSSNPGLFIIENGTFSLNGNLEFHGVIYAVNKQNTSGTVITTGGTALIEGGVIVDGNGRVSAGSSGLNIDFDPNAFSGITSTGTAGVVQNTWRELPAD